MKLFNPIITAFAMKYLKENMWFVVIMIRIIYESRIINYALAYYKKLWHTVTMENLWNVTNTQTLQ